MAAGDRTIIANGHTPSLFFEVIDVELDGVSPVTVVATVAPKVVMAIATPRTATGQLLARVGYNSSGVAASNSVTIQSDTGNDDGKYARVMIWAQ